MDSTRQSAASTLYYRAGRLGLVFARPEQAERVSQINEALRQPTWGELKKRLPKGEYESWLPYFETDEDGKPDEPDEDTQYPTEHVPGFCEGDYPPWLTQAHEGVLPESVIKKFGKRYDTALNGSVWTFAAEDEAAIVGALASEGYQLVRREDLNFE